MRAGVGAEPGGSFYCRGDPEAIDESLPVSELKDTRLVFFPEADLLPWQLCAAHRSCERLVQQLGHGWADAARHPFYKTRLCNNWAQQGSCVRGARCVYAHGQAELRAQVSAAVFKHLRAPGRFWPKSSAPPPGTPPPPAKPEVVFTVDKEEERRRAERAKRFAPRAASFEAKDAVAEDAPEAATDGAEEEAAGVFDEEQIADYLLEMQQQFLSTMPMDGGADGGFDFSDAAYGSQSGTEPPHPIPG
ncbi:unnamed protein product [Effrenium voratum]|uniref:C3H1-type domain-containing protein n=1 Tax=Effrenium voratum TaxID=2562239 RepID=A0AA36HRX8_9DINO|nr:unnamed protein product [Effrenium voratum]